MSTGQCRTARGLSLEINHRVVKRENDMPGMQSTGLPSASFLYQTAEAERRKRFILEPFDTDQAIYNR